MSLDIDGILNKLASHASATALFDRVGTHEPKNAPGSGLTCAIWMNALAPVTSSGLANGSGLATINMRLYTSMLSEPQDAIDPNLTFAVNAVMLKLAGDFTLGDTVRNIDLLGSVSPGLSAQAGYVTQDGKMYRVYTIVVPIIINDLWEQVA